VRDLAAPDLLDLDVPRHAILELQSHNSSDRGERVAMLGVTEYKEEKIRARIEKI
jgi:hypothetical protein